MIEAARDRTTWGNGIDPERLTRYERGLGIPLRAEGIGAPPRLTGREAQSSPVASSFSRGCRVIADCFALLIITSLFAAPSALLVWVLLCLFFS